MECTIRDDAYQSSKHGHCTPKKQLCATIWECSRFYQSFTIIQMITQNVIIFMEDCKEMRMAFYCILKTQVIISFLTLIETDFIYFFFNFIQIILGINCLIIDNPEFSGRNIYKNFTCTNQLYVSFKLHPSLRFLILF